MSDKKRVVYFGCVHFIATSSDCELCDREDLIADETQVCDLCGQPIDVGSEAVRLINLEDGAPPEDKEYYLHRDCADRSCLKYQDYDDEVQACRN